MMNRLLKKNFSLSICLPILFLISCGRPERDDGFVFDKIENPSAVVSEENYEQWKKLWDHSSWNVAVKASLTPKEIHTKLAQVFIKQFQADASTAQKQLAFDFLSSRLSVRFTSLQKAAPRLAASASGTIVGFAHVRLYHATDTLADTAAQLGIKQSFTASASANSALSFVWTAIEKAPEVLWAEPDLVSQVYQSSTTYTPPGELSDPKIAQVFANFKGSGAYQYATEKGLTVAEKRRSVVVAVLDTGIDYLHPKLKNQMFKNPGEENGTAGIDDDHNGYIDDIYGIDASFDPDEGDPLGAVEPGAADLGGPGKSCTPAEIGEVKNQCGHGTHVAGIVVAQSTGTGALGVCQDCRVYSLRSVTRKIVEENKQEFEVDDGITDSAQIRSLAYVLDFTDSDGNLYIHIVNMSIGKYFRSRAIAFLISSLSKNGVLVVAAAGNEGTETPSYPAAFRSVLSVCALSNADGRGEYAIAPFSNFGQWIDICAPGTAIYSTWPGPAETGDGGREKFDEGTSMASPIVAGAAGYVWSLSKSEELTAKRVASLLLDYANANDIYKNEPKNDLFFGKFKYGDAGYYYLGKGALDLENAVKGFNGEGVKNDMLGATEFAPQISGGCVVSSVALSPRQSFWSFFSSMPFLLLLFVGVLRLRRGTS